MNLLIIRIANNIIIILIDRYFLFVRYNECNLVNLVPFTVLKFQLPETNINNISFN